MDKVETLPHRSLRSHLLSPDVLARAVAGSRAGVDLTRGRGQGNGVRVHGTYFAVVSLLALVLVVTAIALSTFTT
jgi:hypothetical protein